MADAGPICSRRPKKRRFNQQPVFSGFKFEEQASNEFVVPFHRDKPPRIVGMSSAAKP
ncbi:hypothetical protein BD830_104472 [Maritimibacter alkaliphilus HTCC2654]|nr:hypothetical protein BD830_104472 [Maritimibacter alkaliphilus HTCC2654]